MATQTKNETISIGRNVQASIDGNILTLVIDLAQNFGAKDGGKMEAVANSGGFQEVPGTNGMKLNLFLGKRIAK